MSTSSELFDSYGAWFAAAKLESLDDNELNFCLQVNFQLGNWLLHFHEQLSGRQSVPKVIPSFFLHLRHLCLDLIEHRQHALNSNAPFVLLGHWNWDVRQLWVSPIEGFCTQERAVSRFKSEVLCLRFAEDQTQRAELVKEE